MTEETLITIGTYFLYVLGVIMYLGLGSVLSLAFFSETDLEMGNIGVRVLFFSSMILWPITLVLLTIFSIFTALSLAAKAIFTGDL